MSNPIYCILSWNIDGYTNDIHEWLKQLLITIRPDVVFLSETKATPEKLSTSFQEFTEYNSIINAHNPPRYHGVAALIRRDHTYISLNVDMGVAVRQDSKSVNAAIGRLLAFQLDDQFVVVGTYVPNSGVRQDALKKLEYRTQVWDPALYAILNQLREYKPTIWLGDINVAPGELDVSSPKTMSKYAGYTPEERSSFSKFMESGQWIDIWRAQHPELREYSWVSYNPRPGYGMRLDNIITSSDMASRINSTFMLPSVLLSDHVPIGAYIYKV